MVWITRHAPLPRLSLPHWFCIGLAVLHSLHAHGSLFILRRSASLSCGLHARGCHKFTRTPPHAPLCCGSPSRVCAHCRGSRVARFLMDAFTDLSHSFIVSFFYGRISFAFTRSPDLWFLPLRSFCARVLDRFLVSFAFTALFLHKFCILAILFTLFCLWITPLLVFFSVRFLDHLSDRLRSFHSAVWFAWFSFSSASFSRSRSRLPHWMDLDLGSDHLPHTLGCSFLYSLSWMDLRIFGLRIVAFLRFMRTALAVRSLWISRITTTGSFCHHVRLLRSHGLRFRFAFRHFALVTSLHTGSFSFVAFALSRLYTLTSRTCWIILRAPLLHTYCALSPRTRFAWITHASRCAWISCLGSGSPRSLLPGSLPGSWFADHSFLISLFASHGSFSRGYLTHVRRTWIKKKS